MPANVGPDNGRLQNQLSMAGRAWKPSMQCKSQVTKITQPVIVVTKCQQPNQFQLSFINVNKKPNQNWMPANMGPGNGRLKNQLSMAGGAWKPSMQCKSRVTKNTQPVIVVTKCQQPNQLQLSFIDVNAKPKQNWMPALWFQTLAVLLNQLSMAGRAWKPSMQRKRKYMRQKKFDVTGRCVGYAKIC